MKTYMVVISDNTQIEIKADTVDWAGGAVTFVRGKEIVAIFKEWQAYYQVS